MKKRVFMLTDGEDDQKNSIIAFARSNCEHMRIHTFGIGGDCDRKLIEGTASAGRGTSSFAVSKDDDLSGLVVNALKRAMLPSLGCEFNFFGKRQEREFFKDEPIKAYQIVTKEVFEKAYVSFRSDLDPLTKQPIYLKFTRADFEESDLPLF